MAQAPEPKPFLPRDLDPIRPFVQAVAASVMAAREGGNAANVVKRAWGSQPSHLATLALITRSATNPATTTTTGWAAELAAQSVGAFIGSLQESAAARLFAAAPRVSLAGTASVKLPRAISTGTPLWVAEGGPAPVAQAQIGGQTLGPERKLMILESFSRELTEAPGPNDVEALVGQVTRDAVTRELDLALWSSAAATATKPAGITAGTAALTASTATGQAAAIADLRALTSAVAAAGGGSDVAFATSPGRALAIRAYAPGTTVFGSAHIPDAALYAVSVSAFVSAFDAAPEIRSSIETVVHFEDTTPLNIGTPGSPATVAAPSRSAYQTDVVVLRAILRCAWALRVPGAAQSIITGMTW